MNAVVMMLEVREATGVAERSHIQYAGVHVRGGQCEYPQHAEIVILTQSILVFP